MSAQLIESRMSVVERASKALSKAEVEAEIKALVAQSKDIVAVTDSASREVCHASLMVLKNMRVQTQTAAKEGRDEAVKYSKAVIAIEKELVGLIEPEEARLAKIRDDWDAIKEREKQARIDAELARVAEIQRRIDGIRAWPVHASSQPSMLVGQMLAQAAGYVIEREVFAEFSDTASEVLLVSRAALAGILAQRKAHEAEQEQLKRDQEELAKLRAEAADRDRIARDTQAKADAEAKVEWDRLEAIAKTERDAEAQRLADERAENARIARERQADLDRQAEEQRTANAAEQARIAADRADLERQQEAIRKASEPKPKPRKAPTGAELVEVVSKHYGVTTKVALQWLLKIDWTEAKAS